ncbi:MAG: C4-type zinc ribbon domain-containing protein [Actinomycetota bacterium]
MTAADADSLKRLLIVQDHDRKLDALRHEREHLPEFERLVELDAQTAAVDEESTEIREARHELGRRQKRLEDEVALIEARIAEEDGKLYGGEVKAIKDLQALQDEIASLKGRQSGIEDQILEVMEEAEPLDAQLATFDERKAAIAAQRSETETSIDESQTRLDGEIAEESGTRGDAVAGLPEALVAEYEQLRSRPGAVGVARLVGSTCHGCHLELPAVEVDRLKKLPPDELVHCDECGCILVR